MLITHRVEVLSENAGKQGPLLHFVGKFLQHLLAFRHSLHLICISIIIHIGPNSETDCTSAEFLLTLVGLGALLRIELIMRAKYDPILVVLRDLRSVPCFIPESPL